MAGSITQPARDASVRLESLGQQPTTNHPPLLYRQPRQRLFRWLCTQPPHQRRQLNPLHMPDAQWLIGRDHHLGLIDKAIPEHRRALDPQRVEIRLGMGDHGIRPLSPRLPERLLQPALFIGVKIAPDPRKSQNNCSTRC
ncbi:hypothetical protein PS639_06166 [Pseudomonas fluorescens]|nr:hypothetical protein PS639_06166 [Pseudomonas fluorescens]